MLDEQLVAPPGPLSRAKSEDFRNPKKKLGMAKAGAASQDVAPKNTTPEKKLGEAVKRFRSVDAENALEEMFEINDSKVEKPVSKSAKKGEEGAVKAIES